MTDLNLKTNNAFIGSGEDSFKTGRQAASPPPIIFSSLENQKNISSFDENNDFDYSPETILKTKLNNCGKNFFTHVCQTPDCKNFKKEMYRYSQFCGLRYCENGLILIQRSGKTNFLKIVENTCVSSRYSYNRMIIKHLFKGIGELRYVVLTQRWIKLNNAGDLQKNVIHVYNCLEKLKRKGYKIENVVVVVDPLKRPDGMWYVHYNVAWDGDYVPKEVFDQVWGYHTFIEYRNSEKDRGFLEHYFALRLTLMNIPDKTVRLPITPNEFVELFKGLKFLRTWFWNKEIKWCVREMVSALLDFIGTTLSYCPECGEHYHVYLEKPDKSVIQFYPYDFSDPKDWLEVNFT